ncbi:type IV pilin N-terminal domain-containing protein [Halorubrum distributum]|uniref:type IV pilin N-terminal domain-containing protein n=1 Tax=Halorubrum distributum TaxID=29283 RepID=UPI002954B833|nr:type IV pilin N-terminal domain-containing protein [Halorubrum distributum]MDV7348822.1 type IV pilin N-terminal domain-containing protein [Halorubrum distributum]
MKPQNQSNSDDRAVSPVIGVILMVAITVILAAVIGTFVLGLGDQLGDTAPQATFTIDDNSSQTINITKTGGQSLEASDLVLAVDGERVNTSFPGDTWQTGERKQITNSPGGAATNWDSGEATVRIIHDPSGNAIFERTWDFS